MEIIGKDDSKEKFKSVLDSIQKRIEKDASLKEITPDYLVIGGDGSLNYFLNEVYSKNKENNKVLYIPDGTANDFAKSLKLDMELVDELDADKLTDFFLSKKYISCPVMKCNEHLFINVVTMGAPAQVTESGDDNPVKKLLGQWSYYLSAVEKVFEKNILELTLNVGKEKKQYQGLGLIVGQGLYAGGGAKVTDAASAMFGEHFYASISTDDNISMSLKSVLKMQKEKLTEEDNIDSYLFNERIDIEFNQSVPIKVDGEPYEYNDISFEKTEDSINFLIY